MNKEKHFGFLSFLMLQAALATGAWAVDEIDCAKEDPDGSLNLCAYLRIGQSNGIRLFVVDANDDMVKENAIKNTTFYLYAPFADNDSVSVSLVSEDGKSTDRLNKNLSPVPSGATGLRSFQVVGYYSMENVQLGVATESDGIDAAVVRAYNFYTPKIQYCLDKSCKEIVDAKKISELALMVGDTLPIYAQAIVPIGGKKGKIDSTVTGNDGVFYMNTSGAYKNLTFLNNLDEEIEYEDGLGYRILFSDGVASFSVLAEKAVEGEGAMVLEGFPYDGDGDGTVEYRIEEPFPGELEFSNYDLPTLDSAFIYDTDGDGAGDSIVAYFGGEMKFVSLEDFKYNWPTGGDFVDYEGDQTNKGNVYGLNGIRSSVAGDDGQGYLRVTVKSTNSSASAPRDAEIQDRIGPVIERASVIKGEGKGDGVKDTLVIHFSKDIDPSWNDGEGFSVTAKGSDGSVGVPVEAIEKKGDTWTFVLDGGVVSPGDSISIATHCKKNACPDGLIKAADGNETGKNNPVVVKNSGRLYVDDEKNGFFDRDGDGTMDSASVAFEQPLSAEDLGNLDITLYWLDSKGNVIDIPLKNLDSLIKKKVVNLSEDGTVIGVNVDKMDCDIKNMLTSIDPSYSNSGKEYGYAQVVNQVTIDGKTVADTAFLGMNDRMAPQIAETFLEPESFQKMEADKLVVTFSEAMSVDDIADLEDVFQFSENGKDWVSKDFTHVEWSDDGKSVSFRMEVGTPLNRRINPADKIRLNKENAKLKDASGNGVFETPVVTMLKGDPRVLTETTSLATLDYADMLSKNKDFTVRFVPSDSSLDNEMKMSLGVLMDIGFSTIMKKDSTGKEVPNLDGIGMDWEMYVFTNLGGYVASSSGKILCNDSYFLPEGRQGEGEGNCFENPKKLYIRWNMRSSNGRKVGIGVYIAKFKVKVFGSKESFEYERYFNWGVKAGKNGLDLSSMGK